MKMKKITVKENKEKRMGKSMFAAFTQDRRGVVTTETMIVIAVVAIVAVSALAIMNPAIQGLFTNVLDKVTNTVNGAIG
jgi:Flp pilus assembly pilin Flp